MTGNGQEAFVFFQLYQARDAGRGGAMPDLTLLRGDHAGAERVWAVDPKLSATYGPADYTSTARRYVQDFGAPVAVVVEHFPRLAPNPQLLCDGGSLVTDVGPGGAGFRHLVAALAAMHPPVSLTVLCVDLSGSFDARRAEALRAVAGELAADLEAVADEYVCFAGDAATASGLHDFLRSHDGRPLPAPRLGEGIAIGPLLDELRALADRLGPIRIELVGDGGFDDPGWQARAAGELGAEPRIHG